MEEKQEKEFSINDLLKILWDRRVIIAATASILTIFILLVAAAYRYNRIMTRVSFEAYWPGIEEQRYIDNTFFDFQDFINPDLLERSKELFANNDVMHNALADFNFRDAVLSGNIRIERHEGNNPLGLGNRENLIQPLTFSIIVNSNALSITHQQAQELIATYLREVFVGYFLNNKNSVSQNENTLRIEFESFEFVDFIASIEKQRWELERSIRQLHELPVLSLANQGRLNALERRISSFFLRNNPDLLLMEIHNNGFFRDVSFLSTVNARIALLDVMIDERMQLIQLYMDTYANFNDISSIFPELNAVLHELPGLNSARARYQRILEAMNNTAPFTQSQLEEFKQRLLNYIEQFDEFYQDLYNYSRDIGKDNTVLLITSTTTTEPIRMVYIVIASLVISALVGIGVGIGYHHFSKKKNLATS
ncbi:MAG: hypothetical protein FWE36_03585 [Erysipelotrichales bacterium]|nr:hypothetical protein [Erysipelotrichales bacterium]